MSVARIVAASLLLSAGLLAQPEAAAAAASALVNSGKPMLVPVQCGSEEINALGLTCSAEEPCPVFLELEGIEAVASKLFLSGNLHTATTTLSSILLFSPDGGKTWSEPHERIPSAGLDQIQFVDFQNGWIAGHQLQALPRDPFFLRTTDGGKTWRRRPVFGESQPGTIEAFWFDSREQGTVLIDRQSSEGGGRYARYETMTGGESWMIREVSARAPRLKRQAGENPAWRVRPHAPSQAYRIEKQEGERWLTVASFLIRAGVCVPTLPEPRQEPAPDVEQETETPPAPATPPAQPRTPPSLKKPRS